MFICKWFFTVDEMEKNLICLGFERDVGREMSSWAIAIVIINFSPRATPVEMCLVDNFIFFSLSFAHVSQSIKRRNTICRSSHLICCCELDKTSVHIVQVERRAPGWKNRTVALYDVFGVLRSRMRELLSWASCTSQQHIFFSDDERQTHFFVLQARRRARQVSVRHSNFVLFFFNFALFFIILGG